MYRDHHLNQMARLAGRYELREMAGKTMELARPADQNPERLVKATEKEHNPKEEQEEVESSYDLNQGIYLGIGKLQDTGDLTAPTKRVITATASTRRRRERSVPSRSGGAR